MDPSQTAFLKALEENEDDDVTRLVYADWLDEHGFPEEASRQRRWRASKTWLAELASKLGEQCTNYSEAYDQYIEARVAHEDDPTIPRPQEPDYQYRPITYEDVLAAGTTFAEDREYFTQFGSERARDYFSSPALRAEFWEHWSVVTGKPKPTPQDEWEKEWWDDRMPSPFSCSC